MKEEIIEILKYAISKLSQIDYDKNKLQQLHSELHEQEHFKNEIKLLMLSNHKATIINNGTHLAVNFNSENGSFIYNYDFKANTFFFSQPYITFNCLKNIKLSDELIKSLIKKSIQECKQFSHINDFRVILTNVC